MRKLNICFKLAAISLMLLFLPTACGKDREKNEKVEMIYFYDSVCASCDEEEEFRALLNMKTEDLQQFKAYSLRCVNTFKEGYKERDRLAKEKDIENPGQYASMLFIGDCVLAGDGIKENLRQFYWQKAALGASKDVVEYYYRDNCPDCLQIAAEIDVYLNESKKPVIRIDTTDTQAKADFRRLIEKEKISRERYQIPYLIENGVHYSGSKEILAHINPS